MVLSLGVLQRGLWTHQNVLPLGLLERRVSTWSLQSHTTAPPAFRVELSEYLGVTTTVESDTRRERAVDPKALACCSARVGNG